MKNILYAIAFFVSLNIMAQNGHEQKEGPFYKCRALIKKEWKKCLDNVIKNEGSILTMDNCDWAIPSSNEKKLYKKCTKQVAKNLGQKNQRIKKNIRPTESLCVDSELVGKCAKYNINSQNAKYTKCLDVMIDMIEKFNISPCYEINPNRNEKEFLKCLNKISELEHEREDCKDIDKERFKNIYEKCISSAKIIYQDGIEKEKNQTAQ